MSDKPTVGTNKTEPWTDEVHPWVNENMNANTKLGTAARVLSRWNQDWHKEQYDPQAYVHAHNDLADLADAITGLLAEVTTLRQQLAEAGQWEDVPDGKYADGNFRVDRVSSHTIVAVSAERDGRSYWAGSTLPDNWRIQRRKGDDNE